MPKSIKSESKNDNIKDELENMKFEINSTIESKNHSDENSAQNSAFKSNKKSAKPLTKSYNGSADETHNLLSEWKKSNRTPAIIQLEVLAGETLEHDKYEEPADFEKAIEASGFGFFNILLLLVLVLSAAAVIVETTAISYILPSAECDLKLSLLDKGILNAVTYAGMMTSAVVWGYVADRRGRQKILSYGHLINGICGIGASFSQSAVQLMIFKYFGGFIICGPFAVMMSYLSELHGKRHRARIMMLNGMIFAFAKIMLPIMATIILPQHWVWYIFGLNFYPWQIFLAICAIPAFLCGTFLMLFPESPKFLMSQGRNKEALEVFRTIYAMNKHKSKDTYPIKELVKEVSETQEKKTTPENMEQLEENNDKPKSNNAINALKNGLNEMAPLLKKPYIRLSLLVYVLNFLILMGQNTVRLWLPQLFASTIEFELRSTEPVSMCAILEYSVNKTTIAKSIDNDTACEVVLTAASYTNNIIVGVTTIVMFALAGSIINAVGGKTILIIVLGLAGASSIGIYFSISAVMTLVFSASFVTMGSIANSAMTNATVNLFPTSLRTTIVALNMVFGRIGSLLGNILFPLFIEMGCIPPFLLITSVMLTSCILAMFLPSTKKISLK